MYDNDEFIESRGNRKVDESKQPLQFPNGALSAANDEKRMKDFVTQSGYVKCVIIGIDIKGAITSRSVNCNLIDALGMCEVAKATHLRGAEGKR